MFFMDFLLFWSYLCANLFLNAYIWICNGREFNTHHQDFDSLYFFFHVVHLLTRRMLNNEIRMRLGKKFKRISKDDQGFTSIGWKWLFSDRGIRGTGKVRKINVRTTLTTTRLRCSCCGIRQSNTGKQQCKHLLDSNIHLRASYSSTVTTLHI